MTAVERVTDAEVVDFDMARAKSTLRKLEAAMETWIGSSVELADLAYQARRDDCWRADEEFAAARASGSIDPDPKGHWSRVWLGWKFNRAGRAVEYLADYGELRTIIAADASLPMLAEPEGAARPLGKLLRPKVIGKEVIDVAERDDAIRQVWRDAISLTKNGTPAEAIKAVPKALKRADYKPLRRLSTKSASQKSADRQAKIDRAGRNARESLYKLLELGAVQVFDDVIAELAEARHR